MDRQHLFEKKPFAKWYHKCMTCKKRKMWASMIKCVYCKKYRHSECTSSDQCQSPVAPGLCAEPLAVIYNYIIIQKLIILIFTMRGETCPRPMLKKLDGRLSKIKFIFNPVTNFMVPIVHEHCRTSRKMF